MMKTYHPKSCIQEYVMSYAEMLAQRPLSLGVTSYEGYQPFSCVARHADWHTLTVSCVQRYECGVTHGLAGTCDLAAIALSIVQALHIKRLTWVQRQDFLPAAP